MFEIGKLVKVLTLGYLILSTGPAAWNYLPNFTSEAENIQILKLNEIKIPFRNVAIVVLNVKHI